MYLKYFYPTTKQMRDSDREEFMTLKNDWDPSKLYDIDCAVDRHIQPFLPTPINATDSFCDSQGNICASKSNLGDDSAVSDVSNNSSGNKREDTVQNLERRRRRRKENG